MQDEEKQKLRAAKAAVTERLQAIDVGSYRLGRIDRRLTSYVRSVIAHPELHNLFEQLAVERFFNLMGRYYFDLAAYRRFQTLYEALYFPGKRGLTQYKLTPVQVFQYASIYGFIHPDGRRVVQTAVLYVPRKFSKTTSSAAIAVNDLLYGESNAESYTGANSQDQAKKCFDVIRGCVRKLDPDGLLYTVNEQMIKSRREDRTAIAQCLTANARTKDGLNASTVIMDEFSQARDNKLLTVLTTSMGVRDNPLTVIITTASDVFDGPFYQMLKGYKQVLLGEYEDDSLFAHLFEPDVDDREEDEQTWRKVHPHLGVTVSLDFYRREYRNALRDGAEAMLAFRTKLLNRYSVNERQSWISAEKAREIARPFDITKVKGDPVGVMAIDLSVRGDFSAVSTGIINEERGSYFFATRYFFPEGALPGHPNEALYRKWAAEGYLTLTEGDVIDHRAIVSHILEVNEHVTVVGIGYDRYKAKDMLNMLCSTPEATGVENVLREIPQGYGYFEAPVASFEHGVFEGRIHINNNPINYYCFGNAVLDTDHLENHKPVKRMESQRIDGVITMLMCQRMIIDMAPSRELEVEG